jgi:delta8-fatty-acid desaturase
MESSLSAVHHEEKWHRALCPSDIELMIARGQKIIIVDGYALKVDGWLKYHPGGDTAILHVVGRDATDEVNALHGFSALQMMRRYRIGTVSSRWINLVPPIQGGVYRQPTDKPLMCFVDLSDSEIPVASSQLQSESSDIHPRCRNMNCNKPPPTETTSSCKVGSVDGMSYLDSQTREQISFDSAKYPATDVDTQRIIVAKYRALHQHIKESGLYACDYQAYAIEIVRYSLLALASLMLLRHGYYILSALCLAFFWQQLVFTAHDAGHLAITQNLHIDTLIGIFIADFLGGLSITWWKRNHNVHHIVTNAPEHDPDIEHLPFLAVTHRLFANLRSSYYGKIMRYDFFARFFIAIQAWLYYPIMGLARFNLYFRSWEHLLRRSGPQKGVTWWHWWAEIICQGLFWVWFGYGVLYTSIPSNWDRFLFVLVSHSASAILHVQITLSHFAMSTTDLGPQESFPQRMIRTTMDVDCPTWLDFFHGGLQFQVIHHLFPRIPRHNLRKTQKLVQEFCADTGIPYALYGFATGNGHVIGRLAEVSRQAAILAKCQRVVMNID